MAALVLGLLACCHSRYSFMVVSFLSLRVVLRKRHPQRANPLKLCGWHPMFSCTWLLLWSGV